MITTQPRNFLIHFGLGILLGVLGHQFIAIVGATLILVAVSLRPMEDK